MGIDNYYEYKRQQQQQQKERKNMSVKAGFGIGALVLAALVGIILSTRVSEEFCFVTGRLQV